ncbi:MAG: fructosamine kinase family protein [Chromatiales bacterium]|jgi:fructosamine-3-kinase|nr:fructosamine kinase family protein [Chromatiales bacterium]MDX9766663.1 fructosamine kinase family protein [Ectothiorhodospiraceae bacterium]
MQFWQTIEERIAAATGRPFRAEARRSVGGGCINETWVLEGGGRRWFVKLNMARRASMFEAESEGLLALREPQAIRVPEPVCHGIAGERSFLVLEYVDMGGPAAPARLGEQLAVLHRHAADRFGWHRDNTIGSTPQRNDWADDWVRFWRERRLRVQIDLAARNRASSGLIDAGERLMAVLPAFFTDYRPAPSVLHGDLWGGNMDYDRAGNPVIFDPAVYFGDRETDIAMTELFGGPGPAFQDAYRANWPLDAGYALRRDLYNLYHVLNHYNLFGGGYGGQAERMALGLLAGVGG